ncbi:MAG: hypothetical protein WCQ00_02035 [bacterium]
MKFSTSIIAYIGNGVVKGGLVLHEKGKRPKILSARTNKLKYNTERSRAQIETLILAEFDNLIKEIKTKDFPHLYEKKCGKPESALIVLSSPWYIPETNVIKMKEAIPFLITDNLIEKARSNITKAHKGENDSVLALEQNILSTVVNGYTTDSPIGMKASTLDINVITSYARAESIKRIEGIVNDNFHLDNIHIHSQSVVSFSAIKDLHPDLKDYLIVDVTSAVTEVLKIKDGIFKDTASFPLGKYFVLQSVAKSMNFTSPEVAESMIKSCSLNKLEEQMHHNVQSSVGLAGKEWLKQFSSVLNVITGSSILPKKIFLFSSRSTSCVFKMFIESEQYHQFASTQGKFEVETIEAKDLSSLCEIDSGANLFLDLDISTVVGALFNNKKLFS